MIDQVESSEDEEYLNKMIYSICPDEVPFVNPYIHKCRRLWWGLVAYRWWDIETDELNFWKWVKNGFKYERD